MKIDDLIGKPYVANGRGPEGYDCFGLFAELCHRRGVFIAVVDSPETVEDRSSTIQAAIARGEWKRLAEPQPGCAILMRIVGPFVSHIGMVLDCNTRFIHAREGANVAIERLDSILWRSRIAGFYAHV
jgi:cell wall-associated NlpC family hydrolase